MWGHEYVVQFNSTLSKYCMPVSVEIERSGTQFFPPRTVKSILLQEPENSSDSLYKQGGRVRVRLYLPRTVRFRTREESLWGRVNLIKQHRDYATQDCVWPFSFLWQDSQCIDISLKMVYFVCIQKAIDHKWQSFLRL